MALTINPAVGRSRKRWLSGAAAFSIGTTTGALASALVLGLLIRAGVSLSTQGMVGWVLVGMVVWAALHDLGLPLPMPYRNRQVPEWLRAALPFEALAFAFGLLLGIGFLTLFTYSVHFAFSLLLPLTGDFSSILISAVAFGIGKAVVLIRVSRVDTMSQVREIARVSPSRTASLALRSMSALVAITTTVLLLK